MESSGYRQAVIHIAWFRDDQVRHLLFGMVELRPNEFPDADGCALHSHRTAPKSRRYLHYRRFAMSATDAIEWYKTATARRPITLPSDPNNPTRGDGASLTTGAFVQKPCWPQTLTSKKLVFAPDWMDSARANFLFRQDSLPADVSTILQVHRNRGRLADWLNFDIVDAYSDYQGAICLVAPNPVFRSIDRSHIGSSDTGTAESVAYKIVARQGQRLNGLRLEITNELAHGPLTPIVHKFDDNPITVFNFPTRIHKEGLSVVHPDQGLLYWRRPAPLVRSIHTTMGLIRRRKVVEVPAGGRRRPVERYEVNEVGDEIESVIGEAPHNPISRIAEAESRRARRQFRSRDQP
jgi:hypothetical protein